MSHIIFKKSLPSPKSQKFPLCFLQAAFSLYLGMWSILGLYRWFKKQIKVFLFCFIMVVYEHPFVPVPFVKQTMCSSLNWFESLLKIICPCICMGLFLASVLFYYSIRLPSINNIPSWYSTLTVSLQIN